jgi:hypothetical protein
MHGSFVLLTLQTIHTPLQWWLCRHDNLWPLVTGDLEFWNLNKTTKYNQPFGHFARHPYFFSLSKFGMFTSLITKLSLNYVVVPTQVSSFCITYFLSFSPWIWGVGWVAREGVWFGWGKIGSGSSGDIVMAQNSKPKILLNPNLQAWYPNPPPLAHKTKKKGKNLRLGSGLGLETGSITGSEVDWGLVSGSITGSEMGWGLETGRYVGDTCPDKTTTKSRGKRESVTVTLFYLFF